MTGDIYSRPIFGIFSLVIVIHCQDIPDVTLISQHISRNRYNLTCIIGENSIDSAITWNEYNLAATPVQYVSEYIPARNNLYDCNIGFGDPCDSYWESTNWRITDAFNSILKPVTDHRWEDFPIFHTNGKPKYEVAAYINIPTFTIHFSIRIKEEAHLYLCSGPYPPSVECYWILLGGWNGNKTAIRKCSSEKVPAANYPRKDCAILRESVEHTTSNEILSATEWRHFTIVGNNKNISLSKMGSNKPLLDYLDTSRLISIKNLIIKSRETPGYWKFHDYRFTSTTTETTELLGPETNFYESNICIAIFVAMCSRCSLKIDLTHRDSYGYQRTIETTIIKPKKGMTWQQEKITKSSYGYQQTGIRLQVTTQCSENDCKHPFWAIDNYEICSENEIRTLNIRQDRDKVSCQVIKYPHWNLVQTGSQTQSPPETNCSVESFGRYCTNCSKVFGESKTYCDESSICDIQSDGQSVCRCAPGYTGETCTRECENKYYGFECKESCGYCQYPPCNFITGECRPHSCINDFTDLRCKTAPLPVFINPPTVLEVRHTSCVMQIQNNSFEGRGIPSYYKLQYMEESQTTWTETDAYSYDYSGTIEIKNLATNTKYTIRAILFTAREESYDKQYVKNSTIITTCAGVEENDITVETFNTSAILYFKHNPESCSPQDYVIILSQENTIRSDVFTYNIGNLKPFTEYELIIKNIRTNKSFEIKFSTKEGAPGIVQNLLSTYTDTSTISISWNLPNPANGMIKHYKITYFQIRFLACTTANTLNNTNSVRVIEEKSTSTTITNLLPYSSYSIEVIAVTVMDGESTSININTNQTESPREEEISTIKKIEPTSNTAKIFLQQPNCVLIKGELEYIGKIRCSNSWCPEEPVISTYAINKEQSIVILNLLPYSNYTIILNIKRKNGKQFSGTGIMEFFNTESTVPNKIPHLTPYSKNESSISLRFRPPFPPTGVIAEYIVTYCYDVQIWERWRGDQSHSECGSQSFKPKTCKLWTNLHCVVISQLNATTTYTVYVRAKNVGTTYNKPTVATQIQTIQDVPGKIENITAMWDDHYNFTLTWRHPSITNGPLTKFIVRIFSKQFRCYDSSFPINEDQYEFTYNYTIQIDKFCYSSNLTIYAAAYNILEGAPAIIQVVSPPKTPSFNSEPFVESTTNTTITINLASLKDVEENSFMYIVVSDTTAVSKDENNIQKIQEISNKLDISQYTNSWIAGEFDFKVIKSMHQLLYTIGNNTQFKSVRMNKALHNSELVANSNYTISILLVNKFKDLERFKVYTITANTVAINSEMQNQSQNYALFALLLLLILPIIIWMVIRKKKENRINIPWRSMLNRNNNNTTHNGSNPDVIPLTTNTETKPAVTRTHSQLRPKRRTPDDSSVPTSSNSRISTTNNKFSKPVKIAEYEQYVKESIANGELERQHELFPRGQTKPWDYGLLPQNKSKNRYNNLVAYDHTRVKLAKINNDTYSDYINANYIEGYKSKNAYIATQGPKVATVNDFWRMIWQENVSYIVMLANTIEGGKKKSEQYWPNVNEYLEFGYIKVQYVSSRVFADYEYRTFLVSSDNVERRIEQLHFTSWPDHGVPLYSQSLVPFLRKLLTIPQGTSPVVVHCSAGVGRTGTIILCDICLRMAAREGVVDILKHQHNLREHRANLVDNIEQYKLAHLVLLECLVAPETSITCDELMEGTISKLLDSKRVAQQLEYLSETAWQDQAMRPPLTVTPKPEWSAKNRFENIIPCGYGRVYLSRYPVTDDHSDYINAVEVDGFRSPERFIVTQQPLHNTISDFWRMIDEKDVTTIVSLNKINLGDETSCVFWPTAKVPQIKPVPFLTLNFHSKSNTDYYSIITIHLTNKNNKDTRRTINLIVLKTWLSSKLVPETEESLLKLWEETERISRGDNPIVVTCYDGAKACGLFIAFSFVVEKMKLEQQCDVCLAVRTVRHNRKQFVTELEQFVFLYHAALNYLSCFDLYSNFTPAGKK